MVLITTKSKYPNIKVIQFSALHKQLFPLFKVEHEDDVLEHKNVEANERQSR